MAVRPLDGDPEGEHHRAVTPRKPIDGFALGTMLVLCVIWGAQQVAIKLAAPDVVPVMQVALRFGISSALVALFALWRGRRFSLRDHTWRPGVLVGGLFAAEFLFIAEGLRHTSASHMVVFLYTAPVFTALGLHLLVPSERLRAHQWLGVAIAFAGIVVAFGGGTLRGAVTAAELWGDLLGVLAGAFWGATTIVVRYSSLSEAPAAQTLLYQLVAGFVLLLLVGVASGHWGGMVMTVTAWTSLLFQGVVVSFASYLAWFWLLRRYLATRLAVFSFMAPLFGVAFGVLLLREPLDASFVAGGALVLAGIAVVSGGGALFRRAAGAAPASS